MADENEATVCKFRVTKLLCWLQRSLNAGVSQGQPARLVVIAAAIVACRVFGTARFSTDTTLAIFQDLPFASLVGSVPLLTILPWVGGGFAVVVSSRLASGKLNTYVKVISVLALAFCLVLLPIMVAGTCVLVFFLAAGSDKDNADLYNLNSGKWSNDGLIESFESDDRRGLRVKAGLIGFVWILVFVVLQVLFSHPWMPRERFSLDATSPTIIQTMKEQTCISLSPAAPVSLDGYVLSASVGSITLLTAGERCVLRFPSASVQARWVCQDSRYLYERSLLGLLGRHLSSKPRYPSCA
jgi:hypothetical protein